MNELSDDEKRRIAEQGQQEVAADQQVDAPHQATPPLPLTPAVVPLKSRGSGLRLVGAVIAGIVILAVLGWGIENRIQTDQKVQAQTKEQQRLVGKAEFVSLIQSCSVRGFGLTDGKVHITYNGTLGSSTGDPIARPFYADGRYYADYVIAAEAAPTKCGTIEYFDSNDAQTATNDCNAPDKPWAIARQQTLSNVNTINRTVSFRGSEKGVSTVLKYCFLSYVDKDFTVELTPTKLKTGQKVDVYSSNGREVYLQDSIPGDARPITSTAPSIDLPTSSNVCVSGHPVATISNVRVLNIDESKKTITYEDATTKKVGTIGWCGSAFVSARGNEIPYPILNSAITVEMSTQDGFVYGITTK